MDSNTLKGRHIAIDARYLKRKGIGISRYVAHSVDELMNAGANVVLLLDDEASCSAVQVEYPDAKVINVRGRAGFFWEQYSLNRHLSGQRYDAFIAPANLGIPFCYRGHAKLLLIVHDLIPVKLPRQYLLMRPRWAVRYLLSTVISIAKADTIIAVSESSARDVARFPHTGQIEVVYPKITKPRPRSSGDVEPMMEKFGDYFVYNGGADPRKNVAMLLRAMVRLGDRLPRVHLIILGTGYQHYQDMAQSLGISDRVHFLGYVSETEKDAILSHAVALVYPSRYEGFGIPVAEGLAAGIPVVTGTGGSLEEVGGDAAIYVRPLDDRQLASAMIQATTPEAQERARVAGLEVLSALLKRQQANTVVDVVGALLEEPGI